MQQILLSEEYVKELAHHMREKLPDVKPTHIHEAIARGLGSKTYNSLRARYGVDEKADFCQPEFHIRLKEITGDFHLYSSVRVHGTNKQGEHDVRSLFLPVYDMAAWLKSIRLDRCHHLNGFSVRKDGSVGMKRGALIHGYGDGIYWAVQALWFHAWTGTRGILDGEFWKARNLLPEKVEGFDHAWIVVSMDGSQFLMLNQPHKSWVAEETKFLLAIEDADCIFMEIPPFMGLYPSSSCQLIMKAAHEDSLEKIVTRLKAGYEARFGETPAE